MRTGLRNKVMGAFGIASIGLLASSTAYACTTYQGFLTASGNHSTNVNQTVIGTGSGMNWCVHPYTPTAVAQASTGTLTLTTGKSTAAGCGNNTKLSAANGGSFDSYTTAVAPGPMAQGGGSGTTHNCHGTTTSNNVNTGGTVDANGVWAKGGGGTTVSFNRSAGNYSVCIFNVGLLSSADAIAINFSVA